MKKNDYLWNENGWNLLQEADAKRHVLEISCRAEAGNVVEVRVRHNDGEEYKGEVTIGGLPALPMPVENFRKHYEKGELTIK